MEICLKFDAKPIQHKSKSRSFAALPAHDSKQSDLLRSSFRVGHAPHGFVVTFKFNLGCLLEAPKQGFD